MFFKIKCRLMATYLPVSVVHKSPMRSCFAFSFGRLEHAQDSTMTPHGALVSTKVEILITVGKNRADPARSAAIVCGLQINQLFS